MTREEFIDEEVERSDCHCEPCNAETRDRVGQLWDAAAAAERERCALRVVELCREGVWGSDMAERIRSGE